MNGWTGKILKIDLTNKSFDIIKLDADIYKKFVGGKGLCGHFLRPFIKEHYDSPKMPLLFFTGPLVNTSSPTSGRMTIMSRSPLTGTVGDTSVGGKLGTQIKKAGWDGIIITGKSSELCAVEIENSQIKFTDAQKLKGKKISDVINLTQLKGSTAIIGPAAENGVLFSSISIDNHYFSGRNGLGLVMAAKNLKYLNVQGSGKTEIFNPHELNKAREEIFRLAAASPILKGELGISEFGTGAIYDLIHSRHMMPTDNFRGTYFPDAIKMNAWQYKSKYDTKKSGCTGCHILCKRKNQENEAMPEFETMSHFSALLGNNDMDVVVEANKICNEYCMDTISAGATLSCYSEIEKRKLNHSEIIDLLVQIGESTGIGSELKKGSFQFANSRNKTGASISVKGMELSAYDPRGAYGMALAYTTSTRGACHLRAYPISHEILRKPVATDRFSFSGKARIIKLTEDINAMVDSLTACKFIFFAASLEEYARAFYGVTGCSTSSQDLLKTGERIYFHEKIMNAMNGFTKDDDILPERFFNEPGTHGDGIKIPPLNKKEFLETLQNYYSIRGLDENGIPLKSKCEELELQWIS